MSVTSTCRDIKELTETARTALKLLIQECVKTGITNIFITETYRSKERQAYLYAQGRTRTGPVVTWTLNSNHANRMAWDIACSSPVGLYDVETLTKVGVIARKLGITWGGDWVNNIDRPHFEIKAGWSAPKAYKITHDVTVSTDSKVKCSIKERDNEKMTGELMSFSGVTLKNQFDTRLKSKASHKLIDEAAVKNLKQSSKLNDGMMLDGDFISTCMELAVFYAKKDK